MKFPERFRIQHASHGYESRVGDPFGVFVVPSNYANGRSLMIIAVDGQETGWEHVSVSIDQQKKCPSWDEMCVVKNLFWEENDCVVQFHPPKTDYVNTHPGVLHLWKATKEGFPMPPKICV